MTDANIGSERLRSFIERIEQLEAEKKDIAADIKAIFADAKAEGFSIKIMKNVIRLRRLDPAERQETLDTIQAYLEALGQTPQERRTAELRGEAEAADAEVDPPYLVAALDLVEPLGKGKLTCQDHGRDEDGRGVIEVVRAPGVRGSVGSAFDLADTKLLDAGYHRLDKTRYQAPPDPEAEGSADPAEDPPKEPPEDSPDGGEGDE